MTFRTGDTYLRIPDLPAVDLPPALRLLAVTPASLGAAPTETLHNIFAACGLAIDTDATHLALDGSDVALAQWRTLSPEACVVGFGVSPHALGLRHDCAPYRWHTLAGRRWCFADSLEQIAADMERKKRLWTCIKVLKA